MHVRRQGHQAVFLDSIVLFHHQRSSLNYGIRVSKRKERFCPEKSVQNLFLQQLSAFTYRTVS